MIRTVLNILQLMTVLIFQQEIITDVTAFNVALDKVVKDCKKRLFTYMTDGVRDPSKPDIVMHDCPIGMDTHIDIDLDALYEIHYVVVYAGEGPGHLDYFIVDIAKSSTSFRGCAQFWGPSVISDQGMRVNCQVLDMMTTLVRISSQKNKGLSISEVEVHNLASPISEEQLIHFRGCFKKFGDDEGQFMDPFDIETCRNNCITLRYLFFGIKNKHICLCSGDYDENDEMPFESCNRLCDDDDTNCGGSDAISVFLGSNRLPDYKGCYALIESALESKIQGNMTIAKCLQHCDDYNFATLRDGNDCFCVKDWLIATDYKYNKCKIKCTGNPNEICGGKDYLSIFETCLKISHKSIKCSKLLKCAGSYDMHGVCAGGCKKGFRGDYCFERDSEDIDKEVPEVTCEEPNPCSNIAYTECVVYNNAIKCECIKGYSRKSPFSQCDDIDECEFNPCDADTSACINRNGSYECECLLGFSRRFSTEVCVANVSIGNEPEEIRFKYWSTLAFFGPLCSVMLLFFIVCIYASPQKSASFDETTVAL